ncbi:hypothetical protein N6H14_13615 [Paenibacillus sp. CC-CFT747]|nr:hypothetical protein N6H14_13615 [Paenibacillus sp. CC-CFT747]
MESRDGLAMRLGRKPEHLEATLQRLVSLTILERFGNGPRSIYRYVPPKITTETVVGWTSS